MNKHPIGVFDSGLGGLSAVKELLRILPHEDIVYFGDTGRVPYGTRSRETIIKYAKQDTSFLLSRGVKMVIAACGTVSSVATELNYQLPLPFTGVVKPTCAAASCVTKNGKIGVIGTTATIKSGSYKRELTALDRELQVFEQDCPLFVPLVENGYISPDDPVVCLVIERYLSVLVNADIDTLILGCTHYPIISEAISKVIGKQITIIDSGRETALYAAKCLEQNGLLNDSQNKGNCSFYVSDSIDGFSQTAALFLGQNIDRKVSRVSIDTI